MSNALGGNPGRAAEQRHPDQRRAQRPDPALPGRPAGGADPPGPGARGPDCWSRASPPSARWSSTTRSAFASYQAAQKAIESNEVAVKANELALEGARAEQSVGTRTVLDVLNAEQELLNSQVALVTARRDAYVAGFQLLNAMGQAEAEDLGLDGGPLYDPLGNYRRVAGNWNDWAERSAPPAGRDPHRDARGSGRRRAGRQGVTPPPQ